MRSEDPRRSGTRLPAHRVAVTSRADGGWTITLSGERSLEVIDFTELKILPDRLSQIISSQEPMEPEPEKPVVDVPRGIDLSQDL